MPFNGSEPPLHTFCACATSSARRPSWWVIYCPAWVFCEGLAVNAVAAHSASQESGLSIHRCLWYHQRSLHYLTWNRTTTATARPLSTAMSSWSSMPPMSICPWASSLTVKMWLWRTSQASFWTSHTSVLRMPRCSWLYKTSVVVASLSAPSASRSLMIGLEAFQPWRMLFNWSWPSTKALCPCTG